MSPPPLARDAAGSLASGVRQSRRAVSAAGPEGYRAVAVRREPNPRGTNLTQTGRANCRANREGRVTLPQVKQRTGMIIFAAAAAAAAAAAGARSWGGGRRVWSFGRGGGCERN